MSARTLVMGIVNVTPDSFSDGGEYAGPEAAIAHGRALVSDGADILDIGGESTRPGATPLSSEEEWARIDEVVRILSAEATVSVDTYHARTARLAAEAGAQIINDVTGGNGDADMFATVADLGVTYILQHGRGNAQTMMDLAKYRDVVEDVRAEVAFARRAALAAGIARERIIVDPGFGFAKTGEQNWELAAGIERFMELGPTLIGVSRKGFLKDVSAGAPASERDAATTAFTTYFAERGAWGIRVHDAASARAAVETVAKLQELREGRPESGGGARG